MYAPNIIVGQWYHVVATSDGSTLSLYLNGVRVNTTSCSGFTSNGYNLTIGKYSPADEFYLKGNISLVRVYSKALSQAEVTQNYNYDYPRVVQDSASFAQPIINRSKTAGTINISVSLLYLNGSNNKVNYTITSGSAILGTDFTSSSYSGTLAFGASNLTKNITLQLNDDGMVWSARKLFYIQLSNASSGLSLGAYNNTTISIGNKGGVAIGFDDGRVDNWYSYRSLFQTNHANVTFNMLRIDGFNSSQLTKLDTLFNDGNEIASHSMNHQDALNYTENFSIPQWLDTEIFPSINQISARGYNAYSFAYPYSDNNNVTDAALKPYFRTIRTATWPDINVANSINSSNAYYSWDNSQIVYGVEIDDQSGYTLANLQNAMDKAANDGTVLILYGHQIIGTVDGPYETSQTKLQSIMTYVNSHNMSFYRMGDLNSGVQLTTPPPPVTPPVLQHPGPQPVLDGIALWYDMNDSDGQILDWSNNGNNGTAINTSHVILSSGTGVTHFDGHSSYVNTLDSSTLNSSNGVTLEALIKFDSLSADQTIVGKSWTATTGSGYTLQFDHSPAQIEFTTYDKAGNKQANYVPVSFVVGQWYDVVATADSSNINLYINGYNVETGTSTGLISSNYNLTIGRYSPQAANYFSGSMGTVRVYNRSLSSSEVIQNYNSLFYVHVPANVSVNEPESSGTVTLPVYLSIPSANITTVTWTTKDGNATSGTDYTTNRGTITFPVGNVQQSVTMTVLNDYQKVGDKIFYASFSRPVGVTTIDNPNSAITIVDSINGIPGANSTYVSDSIPLSMVAGETYHATVNFTNTGTTSWTSAKGDMLAMWGQTWNFDLNNNTSYSGMSAWSLPVGVTVLPGQTYTWNLTFIPQWPVSTNIGFEVVEQSSGKWLGNYAGETINVDPSSPNSLYVNDSIPTSMIAGETYHATVNFTNTGNTPWNSSRGVVLTMWGQTWNFEMNSDTNLYSLPAWSIPAGVTIQPGQTYTWNLTFTPQWPVNTNIGFQVVQENNWMSGSEKWLGNYAGGSINVDPSSPNSQYVNDSIPTSMIAGETYHATVNFTNTGNTPWNSSRGVVLAMWGQTWNFEMNSDTNLYSLPAWSIPAGVTIQPGQTYTWNLTFTPQWPVTTNIGFQVVQENNWMSGSEKWLGNYAGGAINVDPSSPNSQYVSDSIPNAMIVGVTYKTKVNFTNTGNTPWNSSRGDILVMWGQTWNYNINNDTSLYGLPAFSIPAGVTILPGQTYSWNLTLKPLWAVDTNLGLQVVQKNNWMSGSENWLGNYDGKSTTVGTTLTTGRLSVATSADYAPFESINATTGKTGRLRYRLDERDR